MSKIWTPILAGATLFVFVCGTPCAGSPPGPVEFQRDVRPMFEARCVECHGPAKQRGGLRLDSISALLTGGESGMLFVPKKSDESTLIHHVLGTNGVARMPPKGDPLSATQIATLRTWIDQGASLPKESGQTAQAKSAEAWALRPLKRPPVPMPTDEAKAWVRHPIDAFILDKQRSQGLRPSPEAERRTLARRVAIDLTGLPPTVAELDAFLKDAAPDAYEKWVDRLLASPRYGERWARHWLDVVHYADSHGQDQDRFRPNAWPYRDYLIRSFNADTPYAQFVREQIAGDVFAPENPQAVAATGFLAAGPWDESGLRDINENSLDRVVAQYLDRDIVVTQTMTTFAGLTVHCARCHDHKFDPITQSDYYAIQAVFAGIDKAERTYDADPLVARKRLALTSELDRIKGLQGKSDPTLLAADRQAEVAAFEKAWRAGQGRWFVPDPLSWHSRDGATLRVLPDRSILSTGKAPEREVTTITVATDRVGVTGLRLELLNDDSLPFKGPGRCHNGNLHLSEIRITASSKTEPSRKTAVKIKTATADFNQAGWEVGRAIDGNASTAWGIYPEVGKPHHAVFEFEAPVGFEGGTTVQVELDQLHGGSHLLGRIRIGLTTATPLADVERPLPGPIAEILAKPNSERNEPQRAELARWLWERKLERELTALPTPARIYCGTNRFTADGSFRPAPVPRPIHILKRGEIGKTVGLAEPGAVVAVSALKARFTLPNANDEGARRAALADWLTDAANPLTWRVAVNRVWHHHFGKGIVDTPNDFGKMGGAPSHPELLDWLAAEFRESGGSLKKLHRAIVISNTYRQSTRHDPASAAKDADNRLLWKMNRGRLDAETTRDAILLVTGRLDETMFGPPVKHFLAKPGVHVTMNADYDSYDVDSAEARRRSVYRFLFRTRPDPMFEALDCPDASQSAPVRATSVSVAQSLVLWNNRFMLRHAEHLAELAKESSGQPNERIHFVSRRVLGRMATPEEESLWTGYVARHGLANLCRVLFNSSEFLFID